MHEFESVSDLQANAMSLTMDILIYICGVHVYLCVYVRLGLYV